MINTDACHFQQQTVFCIQMQFSLMHVSSFSHEQQSHLVSSIYERVRDELVCMQ
jgi:hypothetical protein